MLLGLVILATAAFAVFVAVPLLAPEREAAEALPIDVTPLADLTRRRLVLYENLQDLDFEYKAGKIAAEDYQALRQNYTAEAAQLMLASQEAEQTSVETLIEKEVAARRAGRKPQPAEAYVCPKCGYQNPLPVKFCGECGARVTSHSRQI